MGFKQTLTGLVLGALLLGNSLQAHAENIKYVSPTEKPKISKIKMDDLVTVIEDAALFNYDEYSQTKYVLDKYPNTFREANPLARAFFNKNMWGLAYAMSVGGLALGDYISDKIDKTGELAEIVNISAGMIDEMVILSNQNLLKKTLGNSLPDKFKNVPVFYFDLKL